MVVEPSADDSNNTVFLVDILATIIVFLASFGVRNLVQMGEMVELYSHLFLIPLLLVLCSTSLSYFGAYQEPKHASLTSYSWSVIRAVALAVGLLVSLLFLLKIEYVSRVVMVGFAVAEILVLIGIRAVYISSYQDAVRKGTKRLNVLIVGSRSRALELVEALEKQIVWGVRVVGFVDPDSSQLGKVINGITVIGTIENMHECLKTNVVDEVIVAIPRSLLSDAEPLVQACEEEGIRLRFMADVFNVKLANISLSRIGEIPLLNMEPVSQDRKQLFIKRLMDFFLTALAIPLLVPLFAVIALAIKLDSRGPVFFIQQRVGLRKHIFPMMKFRSMHLDAEERLHEIEHLNEAEGPIFKMENDPRVTRVGNFLRKTSLDELPQLINVLRGEMSLVGPRPMSIRDVDLFDRGIQRKRFSVQPGITCLWQISGRSDLPFDKWLELDLLYIENWSLLYDMKILLKTIPAVILSKGAK